MSLARLEPRSARPLQAEPLDLKELARATAARWVPQALARGIDLGFDSCSASASVVGDRLLLEELLGNLIDNAIRYTQPGGEVTVRVVGTSGTALVEVEDNGPGIPEHERAQVMERFQRGSNTAHTPGSGLGLAIVREIAATHGAQVLVQGGHEGHGTRVSVTIPCPD